MSFYYTREPGPEGQIITDDGAAAGVLLSDLLDHGPMPVRAALELVAYCADILTIAEEDGLVHGDLKPGFVRVDDLGSASIEGYGEERRGGRAPEGRPVGVATDTYGLGTVMHAALASESLGNVPRDREPHDDFIVNKLMQIDWGELAGRRWLDEVLHFLCSMLAFDPEDRPCPLDVANVLIQVATQTGGDDLADWAEELVPQVVAGRVEPVAPASPAVEEEEDLGGPQAINTPMHAPSTMFKIRKAASTKGEATAFWSRDKIDTMLSNDDADAEYARQRAADRAVRQKFTPTAARDTSGALGAVPVVPPFPDATVTGQAAVVPSASPNLAAQPSPEPPPPRPVAAPAPTPPVPTPPVPQPATPVAQPAAPVAQPGVPVARVGAPVAQVGSPVARPGAPIAVAGPVAAQAPVEPPADPSGGGGLVKVAVVLVVLTALACLLGGTVVGAWYLFAGRGDPDAVEVPPVPATPEPTDRQAADTGTPATPEPAKGDEPSSETPASKTSGSSTSKSASSSSSRSSTSSQSSTRSSGGSSSSKGSPSGGSSSSGSSAGSGSGSSSSSSASRSRSGGSSGGGKWPAAVTVRVQGRKAQLQCGDGKSVEFVDTTRQMFDDVTTCLVIVEGGRTAIQIKDESSFTCTETGGQVACSGG